MIKCKYCSEKIQDSAKKCRYCGEWIYESKEGNEKVSVKNNKSDKLYKNDKQIKNNAIDILFFIIIIITTSSLPILGFINLEEIDKWYFNFFYLFIIGFSLTKLLRKKIKCDDLKIHNRLGIFGYTLPLLIIIGGILYTNYENKLEQEEIGNIIKSTYLTTNGELKFNKNNINSEGGKKIEKLYQFISDFNVATEETITSYENEMWNEMFVDDFLDSKDEFKKGIDAHNKLLNFLEKHTGNYEKKYISKYNEIFGISPSNIDDITNKLNKLIEPRISMYKASKEIYVFILENYDDVELGDSDIFIKLNEMQNNLLEKEEKFENIRTDYINNANAKVNGLN